MSNPILQAFVRDLFNRYQQEGRDHDNTTVDAAIILESQDGLPSFLSVKEEPTCDIDLVTSKLVELRKEGFQIAGIVFSKANANVAEAWAVGYPGGNDVVLQVLPSSIVARPPEGVLE